MAWRFLNNLYQEVSRHLGRDVVTFDEPEATGSRFSDFFVIGGSVNSVDAGRGADVIVSQAGNGRVLDGGRGSDSYVVTGSNVEGEIEECLIFDLDGAGLFPRDSVWLPDISPDALVADLGDGVVRFFNLDGSSVTLRLEDTDGNALPLAQVAPKVFLGADQQALAPSTGGQIKALKQVITGSDGVVLGTRRSDTVFLDEIVDGVHTGRGADSIYYDFRGLGDDTNTPEVVIDPGRGPDTLVLRYDQTTQDIDECLIFDFDGPGLQTRAAQTLYLPDFNLATTRIKDAGNGDITFSDPANGLTQTLRFENRHGDGLSLQDIEAYLVLGGEADLIA